MGKQTMLIKKDDRTKIYAILIVALLGVLLFWQYSEGNILQPSQTVNGLNVEAGIVTADGQTTPFQEGTTLNIVKVNGAFPPESSYFYFRYWLLLKASGDVTNAQVKEIHYSYTQKLNGVQGSWIAGTESSGDRPLTSSAETWLKVSLPANTNVNVPLKYRDNYSTGEPTVMAPLSVNAGSHAIREARLDRVDDFTAYAPGTYTLQYICTVHSITWQYTNAAGQVVVEEKVPYPAVLTATINIQVYADGSLAAGLTGSSS